MNPGGPEPVASGAYPTCDDSGNPTDPNAGTCGQPGVPVGPAKRFFRGIELMARKRVHRTSSGPRPRFSTPRSKATTPVPSGRPPARRTPASTPTSTTTSSRQNDFGRLELDRPIQARIDAVYNAPFGLSAGIGFYVRSGRPTTQTRVVQRLLRQTSISPPAARQDACPPTTT